MNQIITTTLNRVNIFGINEYQITGLVNNKPILTATTSHWLFEDIDIHVNVPASLKDFEEYTNLFNKVLAEMKKINALDEEYPDSETITMRYTSEGSPIKLKLNECYVAKRFRVNNGEWSTNFNQMYYSGGDEIEVEYEKRYRCYKSNLD